MMIKINDAKNSKDYLTAEIAQEDYNKGLICIELQGMNAECVYITQADAITLGMRLMVMAREVVS